MNKTNVAVVGCGYWGKNLIRNFAELGSLVAVCDANSEAAESFAKQYNVNSVSWEHALQDKEITAVALAVPAVAHATFAKEALQAGKHVFVEKPIALCMQDAEELRALALKNNKVLMVGHLLQYHPAFIKLKSLVSTGDLGKLQYIYSNRLSLGKVRTEEDVLWSFAPHDISMVLALAGEQPNKVAAHGNDCITSNIVDTVTTSLEFGNNLKAHIHTSWMHPFKEQRLVVIGSNAMAVFDDVKPWEEKLALYKHKLNTVNNVPVFEKADPEYVNVTEAQPLKEELVHFIACANKNTSPVTDANEAIAVLNVLERASMSLSKNNLNKKDAIKQKYFVHETSVVDDGVSIGEGSKIWHYSHVLGNTKLGKNCILGQNVMVGPNVTVGDNCKIQNNVSLYQGVNLGKGVFCGPSCVFTNVNNPRSEVERKDEFRVTNVEDGVTIGANATIVCGVGLGKYCFIGAGAVVTKDVPAFALVVGNPAKQIGWVSHSGERLSDDMTCPREGRRYQVINNKLQEIISENNNELESA